MKVEKIKSTIPNFHEGVGPSECVILGLNVDGTFIDLGRYYIGPHMENHHSDILTKLERFADECVKRFSDQER